MRPSANQSGAIAVWMVVAMFAYGDLRVESAEPFSIVSMTLDDRALAGAHDVELSGHLAFVPGKGQSLAIIDIARPERPEILWFKNDAEIPDSETVLLDGDYLLLGTTDFLTLNIKNPRQPVILTKLSNRPRIDRINGMVKLGDYAIAANKAGFIDAFDVRDMTDPKLFGSLEMKKQFDLISPHDICAFGDHVVIVDPRGFVPPTGKLAVFKAGEKGKILPIPQWKLVGVAEGKALIGANRVQMSGSFACVGGSFSPRSRTNAGNEKGETIRAHMTVVDLSNPARPGIVAELPFPDERGPNGLTIAGKVVFCAGGQTVAAYDISDSRKPVTLASQSFPRYKTDAKKTDNYHDLIYRDGKLYVSAQTDNGFLILQVNDRRVRELAE